MSRRFRVLSALSIAALVLTSCGGGSDSSGRTRNAALCYATQEEKDAAVQAARDAFDVAMGGTPADETPEESPDETPTSVDEETPTSVEEDAPVITDDSSPELEETFGGGYRRPAVRVASSGETEMTPAQQQAQMDLEAAEAQPVCEDEATEDGADENAEGEESAEVITESRTCEVSASFSGQWAFVNPCEAATSWNVRLGDPSSNYTYGSPGGPGSFYLHEANSFSISVEVGGIEVVNTTFSRDGETSTSGDYSVEVMASESEEAEENAVVESCTVTFELLQIVDESRADANMTQCDGLRGAYVTFDGSVSSTYGIYQYQLLTIALPGSVVTMSVLNGSSGSVIDSAVVDLSASTSVSVELNLEGLTERAEVADADWSYANVSDPNSDEMDMEFAEACNGSSQVIAQVLDRNEGMAMLQIEAIAPEGCTAPTVVLLLEGSYEPSVISPEGVEQVEPNVVCVFMSGDNSEEPVQGYASGVCEVDSQTTYSIIGGTIVEFFEGRMQGFALNAAEGPRCDALGIEQVGERDFVITGCDSADRFRIKGLAEPRKTIRTDSPEFSLPEGREIASGQLSVEIRAYFGNDRQTEYIEICFTNCEPNAEVFFTPENPTVGDAVWMGLQTECETNQLHWAAYREDGRLHSTTATHQPFIPSLGEVYTLFVDGTCLDGTPVFGRTEISVNAASAPRNDNFANATPISGSVGSVSANSLGATLEEGEPLHSGCEWEGDNSVWFVYEAPASGILHLTFGPQTFAVPTLASYVGNDYSSLEKQSTWFGENWVILTNVEQGKTYRFVVTGCYRSGFGDISFSWSIDGLDPADDATVFEVASKEPGIDIAEVDAGAVVVSGNTGSISVSSGADGVVLTEQVVAQILRDANAEDGEIWAVEKDGTIIPIDVDGGTTLRVSGKSAINLVVQNPTGEMTAVNLKLESGRVTATTQSSDSGSSFNWLYLVIIGLIVAAGAGVVVSRRSKTV
jgi:hypothetical protein